MLDEINLAEDAVIERLNSVLESGRTLTLAEKGGETSECVKAHPNFKFLATMNPGGDFGKRELSPALRSRFTEMYTAGVNSGSDLELIVTEIINVAAARGEGGVVESAPALASAMVHFMEWLNKQSSLLSITGIFVSVREVLAWARFVSQSRPKSAADGWAAMVHGAHMVLLDGLGLGLVINREIIQQLRRDCVLQLLSSCPLELQGSILASLDVPPGEQVKVVNGRFNLGVFSIPMGTQELISSSGYVLSARSTVTNLYRILRAMQLHRPVLLEGPPGVGKSSIIANLAALAGHTLVRINLSEHSEISDLLGTDLPAPSESTDGSVHKNTPRKSQGSSAKFVWCDGVFLQAMKAGHWVLLDELNLAPQSVLEGLNACFDHREEVYLPEIGRSFRCPPTFRVFCAQNPVGEGGGRKGLPQSFLTRFSRVFVEAMTESDMCEIASGAFSSAGEPCAANVIDDEDAMMIVDGDNAKDMEHAVLRKGIECSLAASYVPQMVAFIRRLQSDVVTSQLYGRSGSPWEFNLRDVFRWCELVQDLDRMRPVLPPALGELAVESYLIAHAAHVLFVSRLRDSVDRNSVCKAFADVFGFGLALDLHPEIRTTHDTAFIGAAQIPINFSLYLQGGAFVHSRTVHGSHARTVETLAHAVSLRWPVLLVGMSGSGKRRVVRHLAALCGQRLVEFSATSSTDSNDLLGTFEQTSDARTLYNCTAAVERAVMQLCAAGMSSSQAGLTSHLVKLLSGLSYVKSAVEPVVQSNQFALEAGTSLRKAIISMIDAITQASVFLPSVAQEVSQSISSTRMSLDVCLPQTDASRAARGGFEWVDGVVVRAVEAGHWLIIDNVNLCSASVLDRLNSLLEPNGTLLLTEGGGGRVVKAHPNFRIFLAMDPVYGEISRAMRNRCIEISVLGEPAALIAAFSIRRHLGPESEQLEKALLYLYECMERSEGQLVLLPPAFPRQRLFMRLLHVISAELSAGCSALDALSRAVRCVVPPLMLALPEASAYFTQTAQPLQHKSASTILEVLSSSLPSHITACLHLLSCSTQSGPLNLITGTTDSDQKMIGTAWLDAARKAALYRLHLAGSSGKDASFDCDRIDELAQLRKDSLTPLLIAELVRALSLEPHWIRDIVQRFLIEMQSEFIDNSMNFPVWDERMRGMAVFSRTSPYFRANETELYGCAVAKGYDETALLVANLVRIAQDETHGFLTAASIITRPTAPAFEGTNVANLCLTRARPLWNYLDLVFFHRLPILAAEAKAKSFVDNNLTLTALVSLPSQYALAYAMARERLVPDTAELRVLLRIFQLLHSTDNLISMLSERISADLLEEGAVAQLEALRDHLRDFIVRRDGLASTLLSAPAPEASADGALRVELSWEPVLISTRWIQKTMRAVLLVASKYPLGRFLDQEGGALLQELTRFDIAVGEYWHRPVYNEKLRLWKDGGHSAVPASIAAWKLLGSIETALQPLVPADGVDTPSSNMDIALPTFVDTCGEYGAVGVQSVQHRALPASVLREWLALLCTFYWAQTAEVPGTGASLTFASTADMDPLVAAFQSKIASIWLKREHGNDDKQFLDDAAFLASRGASGASTVDSPEQRMLRRVLKNARQEIHDSRENALCVLAEPFVIHCALTVTDLLARLLEKRTELPCLDDLIRLRDVLKTCIGLSLRYSTFNPVLLRELQSLLWSADACLSGDRAKISTFFVLARSTLYALDVRVFAMTARSIGNIVGAVDFAYASRSQKALLDPSTSDLAEDEQQLHMMTTHRTSQALRYFSSDLLATSGTLLMLQPSSLRVALRHVDVRALASCVLGAGSLSLLTNGVAGLTVSTCNAAYKRLLQMFRMTAATSLNTPAFGAVGEDSKGGAVRATFARLNLLYRLSVDVLISCRDFFDDNALAVIKDILLQGSTDNDATTVSQNLINASLPAGCRSPVLSALLDSCLLPVLRLLARKDVWNCPWDHPVAIGRAWALAGLLQVHLSLPSLPVDPAAKAGVKAMLLDTELRGCSRRISVGHALSSLAGGAGITASVVVEVKRAVELDTKAGRLRSIAIQRPPASRPFPDVFFELRDAVDSLGRVDTVISLMDRLEETCAAVIRSNSRANIENLRHCVQEEFAWQGSAAAVLDRALGQSMNVYADVCSPILSGLQHISSGLRLVSGHCSVAGEDAAAGGAVKGANRDSQAIWRSILQYPTSLSFDVQSGSQERLTSQALADIYELLHGREAAIARATRLLQRSREAQDQGADNARSVLPPVGSVDPTASGHLFLLALSKLDHYVGSGIVASSDAYAVFNSILDGFVESHIRADEARRAKAAAKAALYRNKTQETSYEANEEKEERAALRQHFPDHLKGFRDILADVRGPEGQLMYSFDEDDDVSDDEDPTAHEPGSVAGVLDQAFDEHVVSSLVGYHARMVFLHKAHEHSSRQRSWKRVSIGHSIVAGAPLLLREALLTSLQQHSLAAAKSLDWGLGSVLVPGMESTLRGASLAALATMAAHAAPHSVSTGVSRDASVSLWAHAMGAGSSSLSESSVDRDLLLLLLGDTAYGTWRPRNFHMDPSPTEAIRASEPLRRMFERATQLLALYPGNELLLQVCRVCARVAEFHVSTPIGKLLAAVQLLYQRAADWEQFAATHVSLASEMAGLAALIAQWRDQELASWNELLRGKEVEFAKRAAMHWCSLARVLRSMPSDVDFTSQEQEQRHFKAFQAAERLRGPYTWPSLLEHAPVWLLMTTIPEDIKVPSVLQVKSEIEKASEVDSNEPVTVWGRLALRMHAKAEADASKEQLTAQAYLQNLFDILDSFLSKCCVGEFPCRLHLVRLFALQMEQECLDSKFGSDESGCILHHLQKRRAHIVYGVWRYYVQFLPLVRRYQDNCRDPLITRIRGEVKIGKWDQMSTYALMAHSEKTHGKLNKLIREYQSGVLEQPLTIVLRKDLMGDLASEGGDLQGAVEVPSPSAFFPVLSTLSGENVEKAMNVSVPLADEAAAQIAAEIESGQKRYSAILSAAGRSNSFVHSAASGTLDSFPKLARLKTLCSKMDKYMTEVLTTAVAAEPSDQPDLPITSVCETGEGDDERSNGDESTETEKKQESALSVRFEGRTRFGLHAADIAEDYCSEIFARIQSLREEDVPKPVKHRAVVDLLATLREGGGFSYLRNALPAELKQTISLISVPAPMSCESASDLRWAANGPRDLIESGESYYTRSVAELLQLRTQAVAPSAKDISLREIQVMMGLSENMFAMQIRLRLGLSAALQDYRHLMAALGGLEEALSLIVTTSKGAAGISRAYLLRAGSAVLDNLLQLRRLVEAASAANNPEVIEDDCASPCVEGSDIQQAMKAVNSAVQAQQSMLDAAADGNAASASDTVWGSYELPRGAEDYLERPLSYAAQQIIEKLARDTDIALHAATPVLNSLVSRDVLYPVMESVRGICEYLHKHAVQPVIGTTSDVAEVSEERAVDKDSASLLSTCVDTCLTSMQRLRAMVTPGPDAAASDIFLNAVDAETVLLGMFGGSRPPQRLAPNSAELQTMQRNRESQAGTLHENLSLSMGAVAALQTHQLSAHLESVRVCVTNSQSKEVALLALSIIPLVRRISSAHSILLGDLCMSYKAMGKLAYVCLRVFRVLLAKGICSDESKDGEGEGDGNGANMTFQDDVEGTGMGEGQGKTDVSDQIENEEQLSGLKNDKPETGESEEKKPTEKLKQEEKDKGVEMSQNFDGDMYDIPEDDNPEEQEEEENEEEKEDLEREMGEANKEDIVDEKQWDSDEDEEPGEEGEGFEKDSKMKGEELEGETHTRADGDEKQDKEEKEDKGKSEKPDQSKTEPEGTEMDDEEEEGKVNEEAGEEKEKPQGVDVRQDDKPSDEDAQPAEQDGKMDEGGEEVGEDEQLPDDMQLDGEGEAEGDQADMDAEDDDIDIPEGENEHSEMDEDAPDDPEQPPEQQTAPITSGGGNEADENDADDDKEDDNKEDDNEETEKAQDVTEEGIDKRPAAFGVNAGDKDAGEAVLGTEDAPDAPPPDQADTAGPKGQGARSKGAGDSGESTEAGGDDVHEGRKPPPNREREPPNPFRERGDINKAWHRRLNLSTAEEEEDETSEEPALEKQPRTEPRERNGHGQYEYGKDEDEGDQVLADVPEDQATQLPQDNEKQDNADPNPQADDEENHAMQEDDTAQPQKKDNKQKKRDRSSTKGEDDRESEVKKPRPDDRDGSEGGESENEGNSDTEGGHENETNKDADRDHRAGHQLHTDAAFRMREQVDDSASDMDAQVLELQRAGEDFGYSRNGADAARELWARYRAATDTHSMRLCEQLRLVLEPTLATRLQGDYRTGKRINMRRVIGYVASGFRKDKIWLRRTKPAKREYQVMMMIDDSKSMGEAGPLALSALATISNALFKLEVGDLSVCAFAEGVRQLHPFGRPFNEEAGARVVSQFSFQQDRTLLGASLSAVAPIFQEAASNTSSSSGSSAVCLQLCFVISDARLDSDNRLRLDSVVRKMGEQNILVVLIILDQNDDPKDSIFNTKSIEFREDKIVTRNYLDDFPFPYYIAIQRLDVLPDVLSDALRQWFELIGSQIDGA